MTVVIFSGGLDSTVLLTTAGAEAVVPTVALSFNYGQRHHRELHAASRVAHHLGVHHEVMDLRGLGRLLTGSALTDPSVEVPDGHYAQPSMRSTIVPNRNAVMIACATAYAVAHGHRVVEFGAHTGDHYIYPDCRPDFVDAMATAMTRANDGVAKVTVQAPFIDITKGGIVALGADYGAPMGMSWSCYKGGEVHCGLCGTCVERREAFALAGVEDPTVYEAAA